MVSVLALASSTKSRITDGWPMLWHKPIIVELALDFSAALRVKVDWPLATKPYDAEPDFSESYAA